ncbi:PREDICTED: keratin-associated protein 10-2-like [Leptosomus discolor]|uniref:keratin-associated protein 10-2-like n=1 Tax=Leptosomus discolor TaxID=188344 RepID=UPI00052255BF|nr:PREDICTED: keratin-associated protein 10-2-like [Leptosomus discolor]
MSSQCKLPCLTPSACGGEAACTDTCPSHCAVVDPDGCPVQDTHPCPEQTCQVDPCPCQSAATCLDACPQAESTCPPPAVPIPGDACCPEPAAACDSCTPPCVGDCVCPAAIPCDPPQSKGGTSVLLQPTVSPVEPCIPETAATCTENVPVQYPISTVEPCTEEPGCAQGVIIGDLHPDQCSATGVDPCTPQSVVCTEPCVFQSATEHTGTCTPQGAVGPADTGYTKGTGKGAGALPSRRAPFRLNTRTTTVVERCLSRCQSWLRGKK